MYLNKIGIINYKNIKSATLEFSSKINCLVGENGSGKTNILDAIFYSSMCKSLTGSTDGQSTNFEENYFMLDAQYLNDESDSLETILCSFKKGGDKIIKRNDKRYDRLSDHIGVIPLILVSPYDSALINDAAAERRKFMDVLISQVDKEYLFSLIKYNSLLSQRNKLLKDNNENFAADYFEIIDMQLCDEALKIKDKRTTFIELLSKHVGDNYAQISEEKESVSLSYRSELIENDYAALLIKNFEKDRALGYTYSGIHRDDMVIKIDSHPMKRFGSWGQQKSLLIALKLAEFDVIFQHRSVKPILLLDDIFDKLDMSRVESLLKMVYNPKYGQIFITDSNKTRLLNVLNNINSDFKLFTVEKGEVIL